MFLVEPVMRGTGLAPRMLETLIAHVRAKGGRKIVLRAHASHRAAGRLYARTGFVLTGEAPVTAYGQPTLEQNWEFVV